MMHLLKLLKKDHEIVEDLFDDIANVLEDKGQRRALFAKLCKELKAHNEAEEEVFYSALKESADTRILALKSLEEHHLGEQLMNDMQDSFLEDDAWEAKFYVLRELALEHIDAEEDELFDIAEDSFGKDESEALGLQFQEAKDKYLKSS